MLKLRKVEIVGFKSFCDRTVVTFSGTGTTCIVGPNGCGKSNVVDAISWVLGEQSHKSLRAERMSDCIFNGTTKRPPMGLAEVTITLEDPELAEAAKFVMEHAESSETTDPAAEPADALSQPTESESIPVAQSAQTQSPEQAPTETSEPTEELSFLAKKKKKRAEKPAITTKPGEVVVSRRLYRSGQSEYLINGRVARLRDIQEMFMGVGLGPDSYAIIEQGRIGQILATKPMERRAIIEEAAGVTKYKTKKRLSEAKLESSKLNLARVNDIVVEVEKQLASLKRQASKARRYSEIREQMRGIVRQMLAGKARELDAEAARVNTQLAELMAAETQHAQAIHEREAEQERLSQRIYSLDSELRQNQNVLNQTALEVDRCENRIVFNRTRSAELAGRSERLTQERQTLTAQLLEWEFRNGAQQQAVEAARTESVAVNARVDELAMRASTRNSQVAEGEARIEALRRAVAEAGESILRLHGEQKQAEAALVHQKESLQKMAAREAELLESSIRVRDDAEQAAQAWQNATVEVESLQQRTTVVQLQLTELRQKRERASKEADTLRDSLAAIRARHSTLTRILNDHSYTGEAVQKLFAANERHGDGNFRAVGVLADYAEVQEQHEAAIEQYLREELEYVVVETYDHARAGVSMLREEVGGRATFFVDSLRSLNLKLEEYEPLAHFRPEDGVISRLDKLVEFRDPLGPAAKQFLPRLRCGYLTETISAEKLAREYPQYAFVTPEGTCYQGRMVTGGRPDEAGPLGMKRELRGVNAEMLHLEERSNSVQLELETIQNELRSTEQVQVELTAQQRESERNLFAAKHRHEQTQSDLARLGLDLTACQDELARLRKEIDSIHQRALLTQAQHQVAATSRAEAEAESLRLVDGVNQLRSAIQTERDEMAAARAELAAINERLASAEAIAHRLQDERADLERRETALRQQESSISDETATMARQSEELTRQLGVLRIEKDRLAEVQVQLEREWDSARTRVTQAEDHLRMARQALQEMREERGRFEIDKARNDSDRQHLRETCLAEVNAQPEDLIASETAFMTGDELAAAEASYREMKQRIENMGAVNMMALEEYNECEQRFTFLTRERDDLLQSIADTQQAIRELDQITKERFEQAFASINAHFTTAFHTIFGGGTAEMRLTEPDSSGDAGIDIVASPPGKRLQNVLLLSGGEKAMTALALLIAIFRYQPSPFCILDEVDAPLDEANVGRFTRLIGDMSAQTQFIVVTHNRKTMETGSVLYGVTMQEPGVSKIVSVRWEGQEASSTRKSRAATAA